MESCRVLPSYAKPQVSRLRQTRTAPDRSASRPLRLSRSCGERAETHFDVTPSTIPVDLTTFCPIPESQNHAAASLLYTVAMALGRTVCLFELIVAIAWAQNGSLSRPSETALIAAKDELQKAIVTRNEATLRKRLSEDFVIVHNTGGAIQSRDGFIASILSGQASHAADGAKITAYDRSIRFVGADVALINETVNLQQGTQSRWRMQGALWRKQSGTWQQIYHQGTPIGEGINDTAEDRAKYSRLAGQYKTSDERAFTIRAEESRLLMFGPRHVDVQQIIVPQGSLEYQVAGYRIKFYLEGGKTSATAIQNGKVIWTADRSSE
jgi:hypothetical protein